MLHWTPGFIKALISLVSAMFFVNHFAYLSVGRFDYQYNMKTNIITGMCYIHELIDEIEKKEIPKDEKQMNQLIVISRHCNRRWMDRLVFIATKKTAILLENNVVSNFGWNFTAVRGQRFSAIVLGSGCARFVAFIHRITNGSALQVLQILCNYGEFYFI